MATSKLCHILGILTVLIAVAAVSSQYSADDYGPAPQRLSVPGAVPIRGGAPVRTQPRRIPTAASRLVSDPVLPQTTFRVRRPPQGGARNAKQNAAVLPPRQQQVDFEPLIPPRPVVEELEDGLLDQRQTFQEVSPTPIQIAEQEPRQPTIQPIQIRPPVGSSVPRPLLSTNAEGPAFRPERPVFAPTPTPDLDSREQIRDFPVPTRQQQQFRATPSPAPSSLAQPQFTRQQQQPIVRQQPQQVLQRNQPHKPSQQQFSKQQYADRDSEEPIRTKKPVAQVLRRYREDNEDGGITWGFENDDGSFKEETIGVDCVTRGKYGYIDPDGVRREYSYSSGIPCDKKEDNQEAASDQGYIDYQNNRYVLPNGDAVDLDKMVKNRARKPVQSFRN